MCSGGYTSQLAQPLLGSGVVSDRKGVPSFPIEHSCLRRQIIPSAPRSRPLRLDHGGMYALKFVAVREREVNVARLHGSPLDAIEKLQRLVQMNRGLRGAL